MNAEIQAVRSFHRGLSHFATLPVNNLSTESWAATIPMERFAEMAEIANEARTGLQGGTITQRPLDPTHSYRLARYLMRACVAAAMRAAEKDKSMDPQVFAALESIYRTLGGQPVFALQPFVVSIRQQDRPLLQTHRTDNFEVLTVANKTKLWVIDGQHRVHAIRAFRDFLYNVQVSNLYPAVTIGSAEGGHYLFGDSSTPRTEAAGQAWRLVEYQFSQCDTAVSIFTTLDLMQERQMFHDLNNLGKRVDDSLAFAFDESNPINLWMKRELIPNILGGVGNVVNKDQKNWDVDEGKFVRKDLAAVNAFLFLRKTSVKTAEPKHVTTDTIKVGNRFWKEIVKVPGMGHAGSKKAVILAQPVVQKALALLVNEFGIRKSKGDQSTDGAAKLEMLNRVLDGIGTIDWSHANKLWRAWLLDNPESTFQGIRKYLPKDMAKAKGEFATIDGNRVRFGVKHNEIAPAVANLIRFALQLPPKKGRG
jgi:hypothetical protein